MQSSIRKESPTPFGENIPPDQQYSDAQGTATLNLTTPINFIHLKQNLADQTRNLLGADALSNRTLTHIIMLVVAVLAIGVSRFELSWGKISAVHPIKYVAEPLDTTAPEAEAALLVLPTELEASENDVLVRAAVPRTIIPDRSLAEPTIPEIRSYAVEGGDTISGIAAKFGLKPETIIWANPELEQNPDLLWVGQPLTILPVDGVYHQVGGGDTIEGIASTFNVSPQAIIDYPLNNLDPENLLIQPGQWLVVPGGNKPFVPRTVTAYSGPAPADATVGSGIFGWPTSGSITQGYFGYHPGIDIGGWPGAPILAADSGYVVVSGWDNTGYGYMIVIDHGNGFQSLYAHLQSVYVEAGTNIVKGQQIGEMGSSGNSTGPHLHFEIRQGTVQRNPYGFLP